MRWLNDAARGRSARRPSGARPATPGLDCNLSADRPTPLEHVASPAPVTTRSTADATSAGAPPLRLRHTDRL